MGHCVLIPSPAMLLMMFVPLVLLAWLPEAQSVDSARALDALLQDYAFRAFVRPKTGVVYDGVVPSNFSGIKIAAMRLRSGSLRRKGVSMYKEFHIPIGVVEEPYVERLVLVYQNLGNWSGTYYPLPGYSYLAPVLGLLAYSASNLSATDLPELDITASGEPITMNFTDVQVPLDGSVAKCVWFDLNGVPSFSNVTSNSVCSTYYEGHFSIVVESVAPSPAPLSPTPPTGGSPSAAPGPRPPGKKTNSRKTWIIVGSVIAAVLGLSLLSFLILWLCKLKESNKMQQMERAAEVGEPLSMQSVGESRVPGAMVTRTRPTLENEYVP